MRVHVLPILATMVLGVLLLSGVVLAKDKYCHNNCKGTDRGEQLSGDGSKNKIWGLGSRDYVYGNGGGDTLFGGTGNDEVRGGSGKDYIKGGSGCDRLWGKIGFDTLVDESGGCSGVKSLKDELLGGSGNDTIRAQDGKEDIISGGPGRDTAYVDPVDTLKGVEKKVVPGGPPLKPASDEVSGTGDAAEDFDCSVAELRVDANSTGPSPTDAQGTFTLDFSSNPLLTTPKEDPQTPEEDPLCNSTDGDYDELKDTVVKGSIVCLTVSNSTTTTGKETQLVGLVNEVVPAGNSTYTANEYLPIGVWDNPESKYAPASFDPYNNPQPSQSPPPCNDPAFLIQPLELSLKVENAGISLANNFVITDVP